MNPQGKKLVDTVLDFNKKGIQPWAKEIQVKGKIPVPTFFFNRKALIEAKILIPHDREGLIVYSVDKKKYREELKKKKLTITEQARELGVSRATIYNRRNKLKK